MQKKSTAIIDFHPEILQGHILRPRTVRENPQKSIIATDFTD